MTTATPKDWKKEFGLDGRKPPTFSPAYRTSTLQTTRPAARRTSCAGRSKAYTSMAYCVRIAFRSYTSG